MVKAEKINPSATEALTKNPEIKIRTISENGVNRWLNLPQEIQLGQWQQIGGVTSISSSIDFLNLRVQCGENYRVTFIPEIKVTLPKKQQ
jgi:hypothetical protein